MKKRLLTILFLLVSVFSYGQLYLYTYDAAGNRTIRRYSVNGMSLMNEDDEDEKEVQLSKMLQKHQVTIGTTEKKEISIRVSNMDKDTQGEITVYSVNGIQIAKKAIREEETKIDMSEQKTGVYITTVKVDGENTSWKVVKE